VCDILFQIDRNVGVVLKASEVETVFGHPKKKEVMLYYTIVFLVVALIAGILGFGVVAGTAALIAKFCFVLFLILFVISLLSGRGKAPL